MFKVYYRSVDGDFTRKYKADAASLIKGIYHQLGFVEAGSAYLVGEWGDVTIRGIEAEHMPCFRPDWQGIADAVNRWGNSKIVRDIQPKH